MSEALHPLQLGSFKAWLTQHGWESVSRGQVGELFSFDVAGSSEITTSDDPGTRVGIPDDLGSDPEITAGVIERIARAMRREVSSIRHFVASPLRDQVELHLKGERLKAGAVPLDVAAEALKNSRRLFSSSGTSALAPGWTVARRYRREAQDLAKETELGHTKDGSFVFPFYVPLNRDRVATLFDVSETKIEPFERRTTRTLATGLQTARSLVERDVEGLSDEELNIASSVGLTKELCSSLHLMLTSEVIDEVQVNFEWSPAFGATNSLPTEIVIPRSERRQLKKLKRRLSQSEPVVSKVYSGTIRSIGHVDDDIGLYSITLDTSYKQEAAQLEVLLSKQQHDMAWPWYTDRATVVVQGTAARSLGQLRMDRPDRIEAWTDALF